MLDGFAGPAVDVLPERWEAGVARWRARISGFIHRRPQLLHHLPDDHAPRGRAWPSPRTWDLVARLLAADDAAAPDGSITMTLVAGCVGEGRRRSCWPGGTRPTSRPRGRAGRPVDAAPAPARRPAARHLGRVTAAVGADLDHPRWLAAWNVLRLASDAGQTDVAALAAQALVGLRRTGWALPTRSTASVLCCAASSRRREPPVHVRPLSVTEQADLRAARYLAARRQPFLASALFAVGAVAAEGLGMFAVDAHWRLYIDPVALARWGPEAVGGVLLHEAGHLVRDHTARGEQIGACDPADRHRWNVACDAAINDDLLAEGVGLPGAPVTPGALGLDDALVEETHFELLADHRQPTPPALPPVECGSGADGEPRP